MPSCRPAFSPPPLVIALFGVLFSVQFATAGCSPSTDGGGDANTTRPSANEGGQIGSGADPQNGEEGGAGGSGAALDERLCDTADGAVPSGATVLQYDDGEGAHHIWEGQWQLPVDGVSTNLDSTIVNESVGFYLERPGTVVGIEVQWTQLPVSPASDDASPEAQATLSLHEDFGLNGADFWPEEALWTGSRCVDSLKEGAWTSYHLAAPLRVAHPGYIHVVHRADRSADASADSDATTEARGPVLAFDDSARGSADSPGSCNALQDCNSAINLPEVDNPDYFNGVSVRFQYDFLVRLRVVYDAPVPAEEQVFAPAAAGSAPSARNASFGDYDNDGDDDLLVPGPLLYRNDGGTFTDVSEAMNLPQLGLATTGSWGDYDNDGCLDMVVAIESYTHGDLLLRNRCHDATPSFEDVTAIAGLDDTQTALLCTGSSDTQTPSVAAAWIDIDADGLLDLYFADFLCWDQGKSYPDQVFHNVDGNTFEAWSGTHGFSSAPTASRGAAPADANLDGWVDLLVNNYRLEKNLFYLNHGNGSVLERGVSSGLAGTLKFGAYGHTIGSAWGDIDNDGDFDAIHANLAHPRFFHFSNKTQVLINDLQGSTAHFTDACGNWKKPHCDAGLRYQETHSVPALGDYDQNGALDLILTAVYPGRPTDFYWGLGNGQFELASQHSGIQTTDGWGLASADVDQDGDLDAYVGDLYLNQVPSSTGRHWLSIKVRGTTANRAGLGARVQVEAGSQTWLRQVQGSSGQGSQDSQYLHFGLGTAASIDRIRVIFPGNAEVVFTGPLEADRRYWLHQDGTLEEGWVGTF